MNEKNQGNLFIQRPKMAIVISLVIMLAGMLMMTQLPLEEYPSITPPQVVVTATYAGASSDVVESTVAAPIEAQLNGTDNMIYMSSTSRNGQYQLTLYFRIGTDGGCKRSKLVTTCYPETSGRCPPLWSFCKKINRRPRHYDDIGKFSVRYI